MNNDTSACGIPLILDTQLFKMSIVWALRKTFLFFHFPADIWADHTFQTDPDLPPGWKRINDIAGTYYWHIPTGTTQWERPVSVPEEPQSSRNGSFSSITPSPTPENEVNWNVSFMLCKVDPDHDTSLHSLFLPL